MSRVSAILKNSVDALLHLIFFSQEQCAVCQTTELVGKMGLCTICETEVARHTDPKCPKCGRQSDGLCANCRRMTMAFDAGDMVFVYDGVIRERLLEFKNDGGRRYTTFFAKWMVRQLSERDWPTFDVVTAVPSYRFRKFQRGYNPPELLAKAIAEYIHVDYDPKLLTRVQHRGHMTDKTAKERRKQADANFAMGEGNIGNKTVLLVDDITTTGATLHVCAKLLKEMGAAKVYVLAAAGGRSIDSHI